MTDEDRQFHRQDQRSLGQIKVSLWALAVGLLTTGAGVVYTQGQQANRLTVAEERILEERTRGDKTVEAVRALEMSGARIGQRLESIEASTSRVERMMEQLIQERRQ